MPSSPPRQTNLSPEKTEEQGFSIVAASSSCTDGQHTFLAEETSNWHVFALLLNQLIISLGVQGHESLSSGFP